MKGCALQPTNAAAVGGAATALERGPLRARVAADVELGGRRFRKEYQLVAGEPFLRMLSTGSAAAGTSVLVHFPLVRSVDALVHGTPYHWDRKEPERARPLTFEATHDFLVPELHRRPLAAMFHVGVPAWAVRRDGLLVGALWRNATQERCDFLGASGTDAHEVTLSYAIRLPTGIRDPRSGAQLREALAFETPAVAVMAKPGGRLPRRFSLASVTPREAMVTAAKAGTANPATLVLRVYQSSNARRTLRVRTGARRLFPRRLRLALRPMTALEEPLGRAQAAGLRVRGDADGFTFVTRHALTTIGIEAR
jgi:alpha-mannosidase